MSVDAAKQQQIIGYFIDEASEHLETIRNALMELQVVVDDAERINEVFRAAHSVKGGAAMLGFGSIQKTAHLLEDSFKILKDYPIAIDQKLVSLFLKAYETLEELLEILQSPKGFQEKEADRVVQLSQPSFQELQDYLNILMGGGSSVTTPSLPTTSANKTEETSSLVLKLREMLQIFKDIETEESRKELQKHCQEILALAKGSNWHNLVKTAYKAIANPYNSYITLAPLVITELKEGGDLALSNRDQEIVISDTLQKLAIPAKSSEPKLKEDEVIIRKEPKAAADTIIKSFAKKPLMQLLKIIYDSTKQ